MYFEKNNLFNFYINLDYIIYSKVIKSGIFLL